MSQLPANPQDLLTKFKVAKQRQEMAGPDGDFHYLKLDRAGNWVYGADETEIEHESRWAINPFTLSTGFAAWDDTEKVGEEMALLTGDPVLKSQLNDVGAPWMPQTAMQLKCMDGEDEGEEVVYSTTSKGGQKAFKTMLAVITARIEAGHSAIIPIVTLEADSYKHKKYGKIFTPDLKVVDWMAMDAVEGEGATPEEPEVVEEPEEVEEAPTRRRRKRA